MNEDLIEKLDDQAWGWANKNSQDGDGKFGIARRERFAELIVMECANYLSDRGEFNSAENIKTLFDLSDD